MRPITECIQRDWLSLLSSPLQPLTHSCVLACVAAAVRDCCKVDDAALAVMALLARS
jgi:hypothetical protein